MMDLPAEPIAALESWIAKRGMCADNAAKMFKTTARRHLNGEGGMGPKALTAYATRIPYFRNNLKQLIADYRERVAQAQRDSVHSRPPGQADRNNPEHSRLAATCPMGTPGPRFAR